MDNRGNASQPAGTKNGRFWQRLPKGFWPGFISGLFALLIVGGLLAFLLSPELLKHRSSFPGEEAIGQSRVQAAIDGSYKDQGQPGRIFDRYHRRRTYGLQLQLRLLPRCYGCRGSLDR